MSSTSLLPWGIDRSQRDLKKKVYGEKKMRPRHPRRTPNTAHPNICPNTGRLLLSALPRSNKILRCHGEDGGEGRDRGHPKLDRPSMPLLSSRRPCSPKGEKQQHCYLQISTNTEHEYPLSHPGRSDKRASVLAERLD